MSWSDIFYPDNPRRRAEVIRLSQKLYDLMGDNFQATNELIDCIHDHLPGRSFAKIYVDEQASIKYNCATIIGRIHEIQDFLEEKCKKLKELLDPELYEKLMSVDTSFLEKLRLAGKISDSSLAIIGSIAGVAVVGCIRAGMILVSLVESVGMIVASALSVLVVGVLIMGIDMIASAILGAIERDRLEHTINELETNLQSFEPASRVFTGNIYKVKAYIEVIFEDESKSSKESYFINLMKIPPANYMKLTKRLV